MRSRPNARPALNILTRCSRMAIRSGTAGHYRKLMTWDTLERPLGATGKAVPAMARTAAAPPTRVIAAVEVITPCLGRTI